MYNPKSMKADEFISDEEIRETLSYAEKNKDNIELIDELHRRGIVFMPASGRQYASLR